MKPTQTAKFLKDVTFSKTQATRNDTCETEIPFASPYTKSEMFPSEITYTQEFVQEIERKYKEQIADNQRRIAGLENCIAAIHKEFVKNNGLIEQLILRSQQDDGLI